eukprot:1158423-Pelagomonas_calceolata.AAC.5
MSHAQSKAFEVMAAHGILKGLRGSEKSSGHLSSWHPGPAKTLEDGYAATGNLGLFTHIHAPGLSLLHAFVCRLLFFGADSPGCGGLRGPPSFVPRSAPRLVLRPALLLGRRGRLCRHEFGGLPSWFIGRTDVCPRDPESGSGSGPGVGEFYCVSALGSGSRSGGDDPGGSHLIPVWDYLRPLPRLRWRAAGVTRQLRKQKRGLRWWCLRGGGGGGGEEATF